MIKFILTVSLCFIFSLANAAVSASVDRNDIQVGQSFNLVIDVTDSGDTPQIDSLRNNFDINGTGSSSQISIINGHTTSKKTFTISLTPKNLGKQLIPPIMVGNDSTSPIQINVTQGAPQQQVTTAKAFVEASVANDNAYVGVPVVYSIKLYYAVQLANVSMANLDIKNAQIQPSGKESRYSNNIKGNNYEVIEQKFLITPTSAGTLTLPPVRISGSMMENDPNNFLPIVTPRPFNISSKPINLKVFGVPDNVAPNNWLPAKELDLTDNWSVSNNTLKVGQPITRTISLQAKGIPYTSIPEITFPVPDNVNAYPDKTANENAVNGEELIAKKTYKIAYVPTTAGKISFPEVKVKWWDIISKSFKEAVLPAKSYTILDENGHPAASANVTPVTTRPLESVPLNKKSPVNSTSPWLYVSIILAAIWIITIILFIFKYIRKKPISNKTEPIPIESNKKLFSKVQKACQASNIKELNEALIQWGSAYGHKTIYTVSDIKDFSANTTLHELIDRFNLALYRAQSFTQFDELLEQITLINISKSSDKKEILKPLYPK